jgi:hypothetical protein
MDDELFACNQGESLSIMFPITPNELPENLEFYSFSLGFFCGGNFTLLMQ